VLVGQALESAGSLREAEKHYTDGKDWKAAVQMYRTGVSVAQTLLNEHTNVFYILYILGCSGLGYSI
jgi:hypothetical protein